MPRCRGAKETILRDKPLMALSIYHRRGDLIAIMDYVKNLVPQYKFKLRHYGPLGIDTVLYAAVNMEG